MDVISLGGTFGGGGPLILRFIGSGVKWSRLKAIIVCKLRIADPARLIWCKWIKIRRVWWMWWLWEALLVGVGLPISRSIGFQAKWSRLKAIIVCKLRIADPGQLIWCRWIKFRRVWWTWWLWKVLLEGKVHRFYDSSDLRPSGAMWKLQVTINLGLLGSNNSYEINK